MNLDLLVENLEKIIGAIGDAGWWVLQANDEIVEITDDENEQLAIAYLLDSIRLNLAEVENRIESLAEDINEQGTAQGLRY